MQIDVTPIKLDQFLYLESKLPDEVLEQIKEDAEHVFNNQEKFENYNKKLAGNLVKEFDVHKRTREVLEPIVQTLANECYKHFAETEETHVWEVPDIWINFQKKYEHNPIHKHTGDLSFVLWVKIPYDLEEELKLENAVNSNNPSNSLFNFVYTDIWGRIAAHPLQLDQSCEGKIAMFPAFLNHIVYPFHTSDDYRISISGNLVMSKNLGQRPKPSGFYTPKPKQQSSGNLITY